MADKGPQKRVLPPRERRESAAKRRDASPALVAKSPTTTTPKKGVPTNLKSVSSTGKRKYVKKSSLPSAPATASIRHDSTPAVEELLPTEVFDTKPLPTTRTRQPEQMSNKEYQSVAESAVLAAALYRSRVKWLCDGIFEKYWTKPIKKKGAPEIPPNNPDPKSMSKLGACTVTIEPHVFDAVFYTVREPQGPPVPHQKHPNQHPQKAVPPPTQSPGYYPAPGWGASPQPYPPQPIAGPFQMAPTAHSAIKQEVPDRSRPPSSSGTPKQGPKFSPQMSSVQKVRGGGRVVPPAPETPKPNTDPVIQMLASRAASDPHLKELMKEVATSKATPAQLKEFQTHIDEFNAVIKRQEQETRQRESENSKTSGSPAPSQLNGATESPPTKPTAQTVQPPIPSASHPATYSSPAPTPSAGFANVKDVTGTSMPPPMFSTPPPVPQYATYPPSPMPRPESRVKHIVLEFTTPATPSHPASQDRWLFPTYAVLDTPHAGRGLEMIVSFFVERTGAQIIESRGFDPDEPGQKWKKDINYYQPVTIRLNSMQHKPLMTIAVNAKSLPDVQAYMEKVMAEKTRVREEYLVLRLPKPGFIKGGEEEGVDFVDSGVEVDDGVAADEDDELKDFYGVA